MLKEGMGRRIPKADILKESRGDLEELNIAESGNLYQQDRLTMERESIRATSHSGFHNIESIKSRISDLETFFYDLNREKVEIIPGTEVAGIDGALYAVKISFNDSVSGVKIESWITLEFTGEKSGLYRDNFSGEIIEILDFQPGFEMQWAQELSRSTKIVKSRPGFLYPELFNVDAEDVFPKDSDIAIIGDPFMAIDRERATIIEYEYADEMLPPILNSYITGDTDSPSSKYWLQDLYFEDIRAMDGVLYGPGLTPRYGNVYKAFVEDTIEQYQTIAQSIAEDRFDGEDARDRLREINRRVKTFINGDWTREEAMEKFGVTDSNEEEFNERDVQNFLLDNPTYSREEAERYTSRYNHWKEVMDGINDFYDTKQWALDRLGDSEGWTEFVSVWSEYIENLPIDFLKERVPDFDKKIKRLKYWLGILPGATSNIRVAKGVREMEDIYFEFVTFYDSEDAIAKSLYDERINSNDRDFGVKVPGFPISMRTRKFLEEMSHRFEQLTMYGDTLFPQLVAEKTRLEDLGVPMDEKVLLEYLGSLQRSWSKAHFFQQPRRAVALHGFFPHDFPEIDSQDRILALTSVWMHEGEHLSESQFRGDVEAALPFLKIGGKYIIGPINKAIYFGGTESYFDCEGLTRALQSLADEGKIEFEFRKGVSKNIQSDFNGTEDTLINELESNTQKLSHNESASCVIITRLT